MSLLLNMLSMLVITFLPRSKGLLISWLQSPSAVILEHPKNKVSHCFHCFPIYFPWSDGTGCHDLCFLNVWQIDGETVEKVSDFIFLGSKITADGDCSHEIKRCLLLGRKVLTNLDNILKSRDITLPTRVYLVKAMVFPVVMYGCERWTVKKAECQRIDAFELWCWRRLLRVPWTARRSNQSILKEISPGCSLEGMMLKLKLQYFGHLM